MRVRACALGALIALVPVLAAGATPPLVVPAAGGAPWTPAQVRALDAELAALVARTPALRGAHVAVDVETPDGVPLFAQHHDDAVQPASTFKLLAASAALDRLGPAYRFTTTLGRVPASARGPGATGDLLIVHGGGDPFLGRAELDAAADAVRAAGVTGSVDLVLDTSHVAPEDRRLWGWEIDDELWPYAMIVNGLPFEKNVLAGSLVPGGAPGEPVALRVGAPFVAQTFDRSAPCVPGPALLTFDVRATTVAAGPLDDLAVTPGRCGQIVVGGPVAAGTPRNLKVAVEAPELLARLYLIDALAKRGIAVAPVAPGPAPLAGIDDRPRAADPAETLVWRHDGEPLTAVIADTWQPSDNLAAEEIFHELDWNAHHQPGTYQGAILVENEWLRGLGVEPAALEIWDGSGLSQYDRITPHILATILRHDWAGPNRAAVLDALSVAGVRGTLRSFGAGTPAAGRVFAKDGEQWHMRGLAGYVASRTHGAVVFAVNIDDALAPMPDLDRFLAAFVSRIALD